jgi:DNA (cytosine-5)-methyltransferase 1
MSDAVTGKPIRIVSDGTPAGTIVYCGDEVVTNVTRAEWSAEAHDKPCKAVIHVEFVVADIAARQGEVVIGVDINPQKNYPFEFHQADALEALTDYLDSGDGQLAAVHASPPCQAYSQAALSQRNAGKEYPDLLAATRDLLNATGLPWVIENVPGAPMRPDFKLCGCQFGLELRRERWFETSWNGYDLRPRCHHPHPVVSVVGHGTPSWVREQLGYNPTIADYRAAMGIDWMNRNELSQAIPPAYTEYIGGYLLTEATMEAAA